MAGAEEVVAGIDRRDGTELLGTCAERAGLRPARRSRARPGQLHARSDRASSASKRNANRSVAEATAEAGRVIAKSELPVTVTISVAFGCPFEGRVDPGVVSGARRTLRSAYLVVLADTIGVATGAGGRARRKHQRRASRGRAPAQHAQHRVRQRGRRAGGRRDDVRCGVGGLGGCPFAPGATGNIATEDLVYLFDGEGVETGVDLDAVVATSAGSKSCSVAGSRARSIEPERGPVTDSRS